MKRKKLYYACICVFLTVLLIGCNDKVKRVDTESSIEELTGNDKGDKQEEYDKYIGKIWVYSKDPNDIYSFMITALNQDRIEGSGRLFGDFEGTIEGNRAEFSFEHWEDSGEVVMELLSSDEILVKVTYSKRAEYDRDSMKIVDTFRPYKLSDVELILDEEISFGMELDSMGYRYFAAGMDKNDVRPSAHLYMTDRDGNILNDFMVSWINLMQIIKITVEDINEDGRSDIRVWTAMADKSLVPFFQGIFLQNSDGTFPQDATVMDVILYGSDSINFRKDEHPPFGLPDALENEIKKVLAEDSFHAFIEKYGIECRQLSDEEKQEYSILDDTGLLAHYLSELKTKDDAWFIPADTNDMIIRHEERGGRYSYYNYQRGHGKASYLLRAVGLNEEFYVIRWNGEEYLITTKCKGDKVTGIAVYYMHGKDIYGWLLYQEKTGAGQIMTRYYSYIDDPEGKGTYWPEYEFLFD